MDLVGMDEFYDVVVVGTGVAGLYCALSLPSGAFAVQGKGGRERFVLGAGRDMHAEGRG